MKPLSVGNVVSAGLRIYRDNFWKYFKLAFLGYLWILVPIYGWAKYAAMLGLVARLAYGEAAEQPEAVRDAQRHIKPKMWSFLVAAILVSLIILGTIILYSIIVGIVSAVGGAIFGRGSVVGLISMTSISIAAVLFFIFGFIWLVSRLFLIELPLGVEENTTASSTISRSWELTKGSVGRIQLVVFVGFLISIPIVLLSNIASFILQTVIDAGLQNAPGFAAIAGILYILLTFAAGALMIPFWQAIKAVVYYDLRVRREGMGINLRK